MRKALPSALTAARLAGGILYLARWGAAVEFLPLTILLSVGVVTDLLDGMLARKLCSETAFGHRLDLIADFLVFCIVPARLMFAMGTAESIMAIAMCSYSAVRVQPRTWICRGLPLPVVGSGVTTLLLIGDPASVKVVGSAILSVAWLSLAGIWIAGKRR